MNERFSNPDSRQHARLEAVQEADNTLGSAFHEDWYKTRLDDAGNFEPRVKETSDNANAWVEASGTNQVDSWRYG